MGNNSCEGCYCYTPNDAPNICDYIFDNKPILPCPCSECIIKVMCENICDPWISWRNKIHEMEEEKE